MKKLLIGLFLITLSAHSLFAAQRFAVLPFIGAAHHKENLDLAARYLTIELKRMLAEKNLSKDIVVGYDKVKPLVEGNIYDAGTLAELAKQLNVRYVLFGDSKQIYIGQRYHRFNVYCKAFDVTTMEFIDLGHSRFTSASKLIEFSNWPILRPKEWATFSKLSEPFESFVRKILIAQRDRNSNR